MTIKLEPLRALGLTNMEFGQLMNRHLNDLATIDETLRTNQPYEAYLLQLSNKTAIYQKGLALVQKNEETEKIVRADAVRDKAIEAFSRSLKLYEVSNEPDEAEASRVLGILFGNYKNLAKLNYEAESMGIDKLVSELESPKYAEKVAFLNIGKYVTRMKESNQIFKTIFGGRIVTEALSDNYDMKFIRKEMFALYCEFADYTLAMAKLPETSPLFSAALAQLNTARKYYSDMIARRKGVKEAKEKTSA